MRIGRNKKEWRKIFDQLHQFQRHNYLYFYWKVNFFLSTTFESRNRVAYARTQAMGLLHIYVYQMYVNNS